ncbi:sterile alpha motif domain-containing protein 9-like [Trichosurus vulpecula]|uniref:sterile alpha motif domain-containing protein 9-like n=1 Tax=Trichosurus vulpecula TaxID=9337 RepID=UPI00186B2D0A|nr:sterile alpha motif domain-containing protein 9-like [Trichosurus vulpecula]
MTEQVNLPENTDDWTSEDVYQWVTGKLKLNLKYGEILKKEEVNGMSLKRSVKQDLIDMGIKHGPALQIIKMFRELNSECSKQILGEKDGKKTEDQCVTKEKTRKSKKNQIDTKTDTSTKPKEACESSEVKPTKETRSHPEETKDDLPYRGWSCSTYPFDSFHKSFRYKEHDVIIQPETGLLNLIDPVHEFKALTATEGATDKDIKMKFSNEVFRFASACMNCRTNGTIHFGVKDKPHGEIVGVKLTEVDKSTFIDHFYTKMEDYFDKEGVGEAKQCIRPPRFVEVLLKNDTTSERFVIEVDIIPKHSICNKKYFPIKMQTYKKNRWEKNTELSLFVRDGTSSKDIYANPKQKDGNLKAFLSGLESQDESRKAAEDYRPKEIKTESEGRKLVHLLTGDQDLDNSYYNWYILVVNKCHPNQIEHLDFLKEIRWFAVLEFDPESVSNGVAKAYRKTRAANLHFPNQYQDNTTSITEKIENLSLFKQPSWIFCNGRSDINMEEHQPLELSLWFKKRATKVRKLISFLTCEDIMQPEKFLVVFLLLSPVEDPKDPFIETFSTFYQELGGMDNILSISIDPQIGSQWKDLLQVRFSATDLTNRCITTLSLEELNGTILTLKPQTESPSRFLPSNGSSIILQKKDEDSMTALEILCENECKGTDIEKDKTKFTEFQKSQEEHFYLGGKVSWWNFYFSSENYSSPFIKRDSYQKITEMILSLANSPRETCAEVINLYHHPGCGGTTLAMHVLWELKNKFRCAVLKSKTSDFVDIGTQVRTLLTYCSENQHHHLPVLLLVDDFEEQETVSDLCNHINSAIEEAYIQYETPLVIILNCMRSQRPEKDAKNPDSVAVINKLSSKEQRAFDSKFQEIEKKHQNCRDFYSFMIMKENFDKKYIENVVKHILKGLNVDSKEGQLISFLSLLNFYISDSDISVIQCENFLGLTNKREYWSRRCLEDKMGNYSPILIRTKVVDCGRYEGVRIIHPLIASRCLEELKLTSEMAKSDIALKLLKEDEFYQPGIRRDKFVRTVQMLLLKRQKEYSKETTNPRKDINTLFSPLIVDIQKEEGNDQVQKVLCEGTIRFEHHALIYQALARHFYINENNFEDAITWAEKAKKRRPGNSFVSDTLGQVYKSQLIFYKDKIQQGKIVSPQELEDLLCIAVKASDAFRESQQHNEYRDHETGQYHSSKRRYGMYNTSCYLGEIEVCMQIIQVLKKVPLSDERNKSSRGVIVQLLCGKNDLLLDSSIQQNGYYPVIKKHMLYLNALQCRLQMTFDILRDYYVLLKERDKEREILEEKNQVKMQGLLRQYTSIFFNSETMQSRVTSFGKSLPEVTCWSKLEASNAVSFSGLLKYLTENEKNAIKMESIVNNYKLLVENANLPQVREKQNFILSNIILNCLKPSSKVIQPLDKLKEMLQGVLQQVGLHFPYPDPYFLATLLFWPENQQLDQNSKQIGKFITTLRRSFREKYGQMCRAKKPFTHFYLGKGRGLNQFIHRERIEQCFQNESDLRVLWQHGDVWREEKVKDLLLRLNGRVGDDFIYVDHGTKENLEIPVQPAILGQLRCGRSVERVSFYLGFSTGGPIAYDIKII